jgi:hypothetical protein
VALANPLELLTGGSKDIPARQQTLRNTIDWSYSPLSEQQQALFARFNIVAGDTSFAFRPHTRRSPAGEWPRALDGGLTVRWVVGDEVYGNDARLRQALEQRQQRLARLAALVA